MAYHSQTDGQTERLNQDVEQYLRLFVSQRQNDWPEWIACAEFAYNNKVHSATKVSPFYANYGQHPRMGIEPRRASKSEPAKEFAERMKEIHKEAGAVLSKVHDDKHGLAAHGKSRSSRPFRRTSAALGIDSVSTIQHTMRRPRNTLRTVHRLRYTSQVPSTPYRTKSHRLALPLTIPHGYATPHPSYSPPIAA